MNAVVRKFFRDAEKLRNSCAPIKCESCMWWNRRKRGVCTAPAPWWVDSDMPGGVEVEEHMPPKTPASFCESYLPNTTNEGRT
jgi:hypothetical protein